MSEAQITDWLASQRQAMIDLLRDVVNIDSGSYDKEGVDAVGARFERHFAEHGIPFRRESHDAFGDAIHAEVAKPGSNEKPYPKRRAARPSRSITGREEGEPISSSEVISSLIGCGLPPNLWKAVATNTFMTRPDFMSATPGP